MGTIRLEVKEMCGSIIDPWKSERFDYLWRNSFLFETGKIYGIICEYGEGGDAISGLLSNQISWGNGRTYLDNVEVPLSKIQEIGWYIGKPVYSKKPFRKEITMKKALNNAIKQYRRYTTIEEIIEDFGLSEKRLNMQLGNYSYEKFRASLALGYACRKIIYCFPWMNSSMFYNWILSSSVYRFFRRLKSEGCIFILPTSRKENVEEIADKIIELEYIPAHVTVLKDNSDFKKYFYI